MQNPIQINHSVAKLRKCLPKLNQIINYLEPKIATISHCIVNTLPHTFLLNVLF